MFDLNKFIDATFEEGQDNNDCDIVIEAWCERVEFWWEDLDRLLYKKSYLIYFSYQGFWASWVCFSKRDLKNKLAKLLRQDRAGDLKIKWRAVYALGTRNEEEAAEIVCKVRSALYSR